MIGFHIKYQLFNLVVAAQKSMNINKEKSCCKYSYSGIADVTKVAMCILNPDHLFSSCFLLWHRQHALETLPSQMPPASKILKGETESKAAGTPEPAARQRVVAPPAGSEVPPRSRDKSGCSPEQLLQQEGGLISKSDRKDCHFTLSQGVKRAKLVS